MRQLLKVITRTLLYVVVLPSGLAARLLYRATRSEVLFEFFCHVYALAPGLFGRYLRACYYHQTLDECDISLDFGFGSVITKIRARIGEGVYVGKYSSIGLAQVGDGVVVANYVSVISGRQQHNFQDPDRPIFAGEDLFAKVSIGTNSFLGEKVIVMANVGCRSILGAGAVVVKDIPDYVVAVGNPATVIRRRGPGAALTRTDS